MAIKLYVFEVIPVMSRLQLGYNFETVIIIIDDESRGTTVISLFRNSFYTVWERYWSITSRFNNFSPAASAILMGAEGSLKVSDN